MSPEKFPTISTLISALIAAIFNIVVLIIDKSVPQADKKPNEPTPSSVTIWTPSREVEVKMPEVKTPEEKTPDADSFWKKLPKFARVIMVLMLIPVFAFVGFEVGKSIRVDAFTLPTLAPPETGSVTLTPESVLTPQPGQTPMPNPVPTPIGRGPLQMEINFDWTGDGACNNYDTEILGYKDQQYYIAPPRFPGYIAVCHELGGIKPQGTLQVVAYPGEDSDYYGFGVLFGWKGSGRSTTDACIVGVRRQGASRAEVVFQEVRGGELKQNLQWLDYNLLSSEPSMLSATLTPAGLMQVSLNGTYIAYHQFHSCQIGPVGLVAWNDPSRKVYFDDYKLFELP